MAEKTMNIYGTEKEIKFMQVYPGRNELRVYFTDHTFQVFDGKSILVEDDEE